MRRSSRRRKRFNAQLRTQILAAYGRSGLSQRAFCAQEGLGLSTLQLWLRKNPKPASQPEFVEIPNLATGAGPGAHYRVHLNQGVIVEIGSGFRSEELKALLQLLPA